MLVVSDRNVLYAQLQEAIFDFERTKGVVATIKGDAGSKSGELAEALGGGKKIVVCTIQTFPFALKAVQELARAGYDVCVNCSSEQGLPAARELADALAADCGVRTLAVAANVADAQEAATLVDAACQEFGRVDVLVNNAGITRDGLIARMKEEDFDAVVGVNLKGTFNCCKAMAQRMMKQRFGRIVNMSSVVGVAGNAGQANYAASKAGVIGLTKSLARELASRNVTANAVAPGFITTDMTAALSDKQREAMTERIAARRLGAPEDVAALVRFLASDEAGYITGQVICVDGGMSL